MSIINKILIFCACILAFIPTLSAWANDGGKVDNPYHKPVRVSGVIPFVSNRAGADRHRVFLKTMEKQREYALSTDEPNPRKPVMSTVDNRAAFIYGEEKAMNGKLRIIDLATMEGQTVSSGKNVLDAAFSPSGGFLFYLEADSGSEAGTVYKITTQTRETIAVHAGDGGVRRDLSVSRNGAALLFTSDIGGKRHIYLAGTAAGAKITRLTAADADHRLPRMSPNSRYVAYLSDRQSFGGKMDLWVLDRKQNTHKQLTINSDVQDFCWRDNSKTVYFSAGVNLTDINSVKVTDKQTRIKKAAAANEKDWSETTPRFIRYKGAPMIIYTREYINGTKRLHWIDTKTKTDKALFLFGEWSEWNE